MKIVDIARHLGRAPGQAAEPRPHDDDAHLSPLRRVKLAILLAWLLFSTMVGSLMTMNNPSRAINGFFADVSVRMPFTRAPPQQPIQLLESYRAAFDDPPPIHEVLDQIFTDASWQGDDMQRRVNLAAHDDDAARRSFYFDLFERVRGSLAEHARTGGADSDDELTIVVGYPFLPATDVRTLSLSNQVLQWVKRRPTANGEVAHRDATFNALLAAISLGSLGSLVYLVADLIKPTETENALAFGLRPLLGILIAMAFFVLMVVVHSAISTSAQESLRYSTMYALSLGAGLLSEQAYQALRLRLEPTLKGLGNAGGAEAPAGTGAHAAHSKEPAAAPTLLSSPAPELDSASNAGRSALDAPQRPEAAAG